MGRVSAPRRSPRSAPLAPVEGHRLLIDQTVSAEVTVVRDEAGESRSSPILVAIAAQGVDQPTAERLTTYFRDHLPGRQTPSGAEAAIAVEIKAVA